MYLVTGLGKEHHWMVLEEFGWDTSKEMLKVGNSIFEALTKYTSPQSLSFVTLVATIDAFKEESFGMFADYNMVYLPVIILGDTRQYHSALMHCIREAMLPVKTSHLARECLQRTLQEHGLDILFFCNGNFLVGEIKKICAFSGSLEHTSREKLYSAVSSIRYPTRAVGSIYDIHEPTIDLSPNGAENRLLRSIEEVLLSDEFTNIRESQSQSYRWIEHQLEELHKNIT